MRPRTQAIPATYVIPYYTPMYRLCIRRIIQSLLERLILVKMQVTVFGIGVVWYTMGTAWAMLISGRPTEA
jgi:hypothetical protein